MTSRIGIMPVEFCYYRGRDVKCRSCSAEIAEKAIVCYRCGTPTALPPPPGAGASGGVRRGISPLAPVLTILLLIAAGVWLIPKTPAGTGARWAAWAALVVATVAVVWFFRRAGVRIH
jgi:hypothetical protein